MQRLVAVDPERFVARWNIVASNTMCDPAGASTTCSNSSISGPEGNASTLVTADRDEYRTRFLVGQSGNRFSDAATRWRRLDVAAGVVIRGARMGDLRSLLQLRQPGGARDFAGARKHGTSRSLLSSSYHKLRRFDASIPPQLSR